ncbi:MAG: ATP-binding cassette domain-containing protein [Spirochaetaceae bacterium]|jgi:energy-coupling factor transport system ATP-binding protein|nr:ATP-binding cassette domain-containing protein [Spirochaetaceae bacterium]
MISVENVDYIYPSGKRALSNINLRIKKGEFVAIVGHNGSGKSTLAALISGLERPSKGKIFLDGIDVRDKKNFLKLRKTAGIVFQNPENQLVFEKVKDDITFGLKNIGVNDAEIEKRIEAISCKMRIEKFTDSFELSMGQKQRVAIAGVLAMEPLCVIFDEPTAMLDPKGKKDIHNIVVDLHKQGMTIVYVTNVIDEVLSAERIIILENGVVKYEVKQMELYNNAQKLKESGLEMPLIIDMILNLKHKGVNLNISELNIDGVANAIVEWGSLANK